MARDIFKKKKKKIPKGKGAAACVAFSVTFPQDNTMTSLLQSNF